MTKFAVRVLPGEQVAEQGNQEDGDGTQCIPEFRNIGRDRVIRLAPSASRLSEADQMHWIPFHICIRRTPVWLELHIYTGIGQCSGTRRLLHEGNLCPHQIVRELCGYQLQVLSRIIWLQGHRITVVDPLLAF